MVPPSAEPLSTVAAQMGQDEVGLLIREGQVGYMGRILVQTTLPHSRPEGNEYERTSNLVTLSMMAPRSIGLPYGTIPRLVLAWVTTEAVRTKERQLLLGPSLSAFLEKLDLGRRGGPRGEITRLKNQMRRLFATTIVASYSGPGADAVETMTIADSAWLFWNPKDPEQAALWDSTITLSERFFREVTEHPVPLDLAILRALRRSPMGLDAYAWLSWRLSFLSEVTTVPWPSLEGQFGGSYKRSRAFREKFLKALQGVLAYYPDAQCVPTSIGLELRPSRPSVPRLARQG